MYLECQFSQMTAMESTFEELLKGDILLSSVGNQQKLAVNIAFILTSEEETAALDYSTINFIEEFKSLKNIATNERGNMEQNGFSGTAICELSRRGPLEKFHRKNANGRCFKNDKLGHFLIVCRPQSSSRQHRHAL